MLERFLLTDRVAIVTGAGRSGSHGSARGWYAFGVDIAPFADQLARGVDAGHA